MNEKKIYLWLVFLLIFILFAPQTTFADVNKQHLFKDRVPKPETPYQISKAQEDVSLEDINDRRIIIKLSDLNAFETSAFEVEIVEENILEKEKILIVRVPKHIDFTKKLDELRQSNLILFAEPDYKVKSSFVPSQTPLNNQWYLQQINMLDAWDVYQGSKDTTIAVLDTGVNSSHPALKGQILSGYDFVNNNKNPLDDNGHGTHIAGIIAANTTKKMTGLDFDANILPVKVIDHNGDGYASDILKGIYYAIEQNVDVINMSYVNYAYSKIEEEALWEAHDKGIIVVAASGNEGWNKPAYPASYPPVISVSATNKYDHRARFSNYGDWIDISAPGVNIYSSNYLGGFQFASGTSFAAPIVSSIAGMLKAQHPDWSPAQIEWALESTAYSKDNEEWSNQIGFGRVDALESFTTELTNGAKADKPAPKSIELKDNYSIHDQISLPLDSNWYIFALPKDTEIAIELSNLPKHLDLIGTLFQYNNGKLVEFTTIDQGNKGEEELLTIKLTAGTYYLAVYDYYGHWSKDAYKLQVAEIETLFTDVTRYRKQIKYLAGNDIIKGYEDGSFRPEANITRIQAVQMILKEMGINPSNYNAPNPNFKDIKPDSYGYDAVATAVDIGFIKGKDNGTFDKYGNLTRAQMAAIMVKAYELTGTSTRNFKDVPPDHWAYDVVNKLAATEITNGYEDNTFRPNENLSRAHFAVFLYKKIENEN